MPNSIFLIISKNSENNTPEQMGSQGNPPSFNFVYLLLDMQTSYTWFYFQLVKKLALMSNNGKPI